MRFVVRSLIVIGAAAPVLVFGLYAFSSRWFYPQVLPTEWNLGVFTRVVTDTRTWTALCNGLVIAVSVTALALLVGTPAAHTLALRMRQGREAITTLLFLPTLLPPVAIGMGLNSLFLRLGLDSTLFGVALAHVVPVLPYTILTLVGVFARFDPAFADQAIVLGAPPHQAFWQITLRMVLPGIAVAALFAFLGSWSQYLLTLLIGGGQVLTLPMLLFAATSGSNPALVAALALLFIIPPMAATALAARHLARPITETQLPNTL